MTKVCRWNFHVCVCVETEALLHHTILKKSWRELRPHHYLANFASLHRGLLTIFVLLICGIKLKRFHILLGMLQVDPVKFGLQVLLWLTFCGIKNYVDHIVVNWRRWTQNRFHAGVKMNDLKETNWNRHSFLLNIDMPIKPAWIFLLIKLKHSILV